MQKWHQANSRAGPSRRATPREGQKHPSGTCHVGGNQPMAQRNALPGPVDPHQWTATQRQHPLIDTLFAAHWMRLHCAAAEWQQSTLRSGTSAPVPDQLSICRAKTGVPRQSKLQGNMAWWVRTSCEQASARHATQGDTGEDTIWSSAARGTTDIRQAAPRGLIHKLPRTHTGGTAGPRQVWAATLSRRRAW